MCTSDEPLTLRALQHQVAAWSTRNFPGKQPYQPLLGAIEELGELAHAHLKDEQGIRGTAAEHHAAKVDAVADTIIFLADYCEQNGIDFQQAVETTWAQVRQRNWQANPQSGSQEGPQRLVCGPGERPTEAEAAQIRAWLTDDSRATFDDVIAACYPWLVPEPSGRAREAAEAVLGPVAWGSAASTRAECPDVEAERAER